MSEIEHIRLNKVEVKLADTDDPIALKISWEPAKSGGASFKTQKLEQTSEKITIRSTIGAKLFALVFVLPGLAAVIACPYFLIIKGEIGTGLFMLLWGSLFGGAGLFLLKSSKNFTIDKLAGVYYFGKAFDAIQPQPSSQQGNCSDIYAIQLLDERIRSSSSNGGSRTYTSYELNLVLKNSERLNILDHGKAEDIEKAAKLLAHEFNIPIWKAHY